MAGSISNQQQRSDWSDLQAELFEIILQRLPLMDYLSCREVCSSWRTIVDDALATKRRCPPAPQFPLLLSVPDEPNHPTNLISLTQYRLYTLPTRFHHEDWVASADGWLIIQKFYAKPKGQSYGLLWFYNPVSKATFMLPKLSLFSDLDLQEESISSSRVVVSSKPDSPELLVAISILIEHEDQFKQQLSFCKVTHNTWTLIETNESRAMIFEDIAIHGCKLYAISEDGSQDSVIIFDLNDSNAIRAERLVILEPKPNRIIPLFEVKSGLEYHTDIEKSFLVVDSTCGELLLVLHLYDEIVDPECDEYVICTKGFRVFKLDMSGTRWLEVDGLVDRFLLFDDAGIQVISATNVNGPWKLIRGNCIYFCVSNYRLPEDSLFKGYVERDVGVFSLIDKSIRRFPLNASLQVSGRNMWFTPSLW